MRQRTMNKRRRRRERERVEFEVMWRSPEFQSKVLADVARAAALHAAGEIHQKLYGEPLPDELVVRAFGTAAPRCGRKGIKYGTG